MLHDKVVFDEFRACVGSDRIMRTFSPVIGTATPRTVTNDWDCSLITGRGQV